MSSFLRRHAAFSVVFILLGTLFFLSIREGNDWGGDFAIYILEARNIATHRALSDSTYVMTADSARNHPAVYPPVSSLAIAPVYALRGIDYKSFKRVLTFFLWISLLFYYSFGCDRGIPPTVMAVLLLIFGLAPLVFTLGTYVGSDAMFLCTGGAAVFAIDRIYRRRWDELRPVAAACLTAALLTLCYLTRAAGLALIVGFCAGELWRARRIRLFGAASLALTAAALFVCTRFLYRASAQYASQFVLQPRQWLENAIGYLQTPALLWVTAPALLRYSISSAALLLVLLGFARRLRKPEMVEFSALAWMAMLTGYWLNDKRYVLPMLPFAEMYAAEALIFLLARMQPARRQKLSLAACGAVAVLVSLGNLRAFDRTPVREGVTDSAFVGVCYFLRTQTAADALILSWNPRIFALCTEKSSALYPRESQPAEFAQKIPGRGSRYLVLHKRDDDYGRLGPYLKYASPHLRVVFENAEFRVYAIG